MPPPSPSSNPGIAPEAAAVIEQLSQLLLRTFINRFPGGFIDPGTLITVAREDENGEKIPKVTNIGQLLAELNDNMLRLNDAICDHCDLLEEERGTKRKKRRRD